MPSARVAFFSTPETVLRAHLSPHELALYDSDDPASREQVVWTSPSKLAFVVRHWIATAVILGTLAVTAVVLGLGLRGAPRIVIIGLVMCVIAVATMVIEVRLFFRNYTRYVITPDRIMRMDGFVDKRSQAIEWDKITDIGDYLGVLGQFLNFGDITVETANENSKFSQLKDVPYPHDFQEAMLAARTRKARPRSDNANLGALTALESLLRDGSVLVEPVLNGRGWRVRRESSAGPPPVGAPPS